ncbi:hypothetical protein [Neobacillus cucumis]|nr:hypothetical protein [Neobacillus cucumis]MBM7656564.1 hypothetical protein [Neobacillus cucumis]
MLTEWVCALMFNKPGTPYIFEILQISQHSVNTSVPYFLFQGDD